MEKKHSQLIILDFDHTIFNTTLFVEALSALFERRFDISKKAFLAAREQMKTCALVIDIDHFVKEFPNQDTRELHDAVHSLIKERAADFLFPDVLGFIDRHRDRFDILISTHGDSELQHEKIIHSLLPKDIPFIISKKKKSDVLAPLIEIYTKIHLIEDKSENIDDIKQRFPSVYAYQLKRPNDCKYCNTRSSCDCVDTVVTDLSFTIHS